ncbi:MAG: adenosylcobinamide-phosphate synthase CbiB [Prevotella sp.]|jgi:adenosylcobinamide-phosphate synthase|nr:adenosylcobinamide-phosphate synthase CbiB [Prevotella sp.]
MDIIFFIVLPMLTGWLLDRMLGDPAWLPHPVVLFGKVIAWGDRRWNKGDSRMLKGGFFAVSLIVLAFIITGLAVCSLFRINLWLAIAFNSVIVFYCLAGKTLSGEVRDVFLAAGRSVEEGRRQVARIVGRDTSGLSPQQIRTAALETLSENLSDGVIAPVFWYILLGVPGMMAYKMINTLDSMIGYKSERYKRFGCVAARIDDVANYIPARLTAALMILCNGDLKIFSFVKKYGSQHASPNSGYPEAALAGILDCRFGGPNIYFGSAVNKPYIGSNDRLIITSDMRIAIGINLKSEILMLLLVILYGITLSFIIR